MNPQVWSIEAIKNSLIAIQHGIRVRTSPELEIEEFAPDDPHRQGAEATLTYVASSFGIDMKAPSSSQPAASSLRVWSREDIQDILNEASTVLKQVTASDSPKVVAYRQGIEYTMEAVAFAFSVRIPRLEFSSDSELDALSEQDEQPLTADNPFLDKLRPRRTDALEDILKTVSMSTLQSGLRAVLRAWHNSSSDEHVLDNLFLYQKYHNEGVSSPREATNIIIEEALNLLAQEHAEETQLLRQRFIDRKSVKEIAHQLNTTEGTVFKRQRKALVSLTAILHELELQAREAYQAEMGKEYWLADAGSLKPRFISSDQENPITITLDQGDSARNLTPSYLESVVTPYLAAIAGIQELINEIDDQDAKSRKIQIRSISQNSPIQVTVDGLTKAIQLIAELVVPWRRKHSESMARLIEQEKREEIKAKSAELVELRARVEKNAIEKAKLSAEAEKERAEAERIWLENEKLKLELADAKLELVLKFLERINPNLSEKERIAYTTRFLPHLETILSSPLEMKMKVETPLSEKLEDE